MNFKTTRAECIFLFRRGIYKLTGNRNKEHLDLGRQLIRNEIIVLHEVCTHKTFRAIESGGTPSTNP